MINSVSTRQQDLMRKYGALGAGLAIGMVIPAYTVYDSLKKMTPDKAKYDADSFQKLMPVTDTFENIKPVAEKVLKESGLKAKGVKLTFIDGTKESLEHLKNLCESEVGIKNSFQRRIKDNYFETLKNGANAIFFPKNNECIVHTKKSYDSVFHEMGHAMNKNGNFITKALKKTRILTPFEASIVAPIALATALLHKVDKTKPKERKSFFEKTNDFIAENAVGLTALSYVPILAEEGLASIRGLKAVKPHVSKEVFGKLAKNYTIAWRSYGLIAAGVTAGVAAGINIAKYIKNTDNNKSV